MCNDRLLNPPQHINGYTYIWPIDMGKVVGVETHTSTGRHPLGAFV